MVGLDLDGTVFNNNKEITAHTRNVLEEAIRQGVTVLVATGRPWMGVPEFLKSFPGMARSRCAGEDPDGECRYDSPLP